jgi:predicted esterase YcpF (UPF0227 family)
MKTTSPVGRTSPGFRSPSAAQRARELLGVAAPIRFALGAHNLIAAPRGTQPLLVFPGLGSGNGPLAPLRAYLRRCGHDARPWTVGVNGGDLPVLIEQCLELAEQVVTEVGQPVGLIGWSLGGVVAREVARDRPDLVSRVATFGSPLHGPRYTAARRVYEGQRLDEIEAMIDDRYRRGIERPVLSIYSRNDGVVDWRSCIDDLTPGAVRCEVASTHLTMGFDPAVWLALARWFAD